MSFMKTWVLLKMLKRGVQPDKEILDVCITFIEKFARTEGNDTKPFNVLVEDDVIKIFRDETGDDE